jgi:hypothetical protein
MHRECVERGLLTVILGNDPAMLITVLPLATEPTVILGNDPAVLISIMPHHRMIAQLHCVDPYFAQPCTHCQLECIVYSEYRTVYSEYCV